MNNETRNLVTAYNAAVTTAVNEPTDDNMAAVSATYAAIPAAARGGAMASALSNVSDPTAIGALIEAHNNLPTPSSRTERRTLTDEEARPHPGAHHRRPRLDRSGR